MKISTALFETVEPFRDLYRRELNCQIVHDSAYYRENCVQPYLIEADGQAVGYGSVWIGSYWMAPGGLFEFYVLPGHQPRLFSLFEAFLREVNPRRIYAQTNDRFLGSLIFDYARDITVEHILFSEGVQTGHAAPGVTFRRALPEEKERIFTHCVEPVGDWVLDWNGRIVATGGVLYHYNRPFGDVFMEVDGEFRRRGLGRFLVQELKNVCRASGRVPAARCQPRNIASRKTLESAGFVPCGRLIHGDAFVPEGKKPSVKK